MHCSDALLIASGTATLEAMFLKKPMVISYRMAAASWMLLSRMVKTPFVGLPNILAREAVAPEILQQDATAPRLADEVMRVLDQVERLRWPDLTTWLVRSGVTLPVVPSRRCLRWSSVNADS